MPALRLRSTRKAGVIAANLHVSCDPEERVVSIAWPGVVGPTSHRLATDPLPSASDFLLPELAGMQRLEVLQLLHRNALMAHMPEAWFQAGSFPRLSKLWIELGILQPPLPDVAPGALPELHTLHITVHTQKQPFVLPSSWGAQPSVLPALRRLHLELPVAPPLPPVWARGFRQLESLNFMQATKVGGSYVNVPLWGQPPWNASKRLPPEWASGFPALISLDLAYQGVTGSVPDAWQRRGAFPALQTLDLGSNRLEGPLPADIFSNLPQLRVLDLGGNALTGSLPAEWASMGSVATVSVSRNWLEGPAFPAAWLAPTALMDVTNLALDANPALTGTLPADLGLLSLVSMDVSSTGMTGSIPEEWCMAPFHKKLSRLGVAGSGISPVLPACAARDMPQLMLLQLVGEGNGLLVQLGEGADGVVFLARMGDLYCAVKVVELQLGMHSEAFWGEVALLHRCTHPRIVPVYGVAIEGQLLLVAMQLMLGGSLREALLDPQRQELLRWENRGKQVAADVAEALVFLHSRNVMHNDLKLGNVLLSEDMRACVADLGMAQMLAGSARTVPGGTNLYAAPEQLMGLRCTLAVDVYGLGLLLVELTTRRLILRRGQFNLPRAPDDCPQAVVELIASCLSLEPKHRPTAAQWSAKMEEAFEAAVQLSGGLAEAKPRAMLDHMQGAFPDLSLANVKWHLLAVRRREERQREAGGPPENAPLKWMGRLEEAYQAAVEQLGGLHAARPKGIHDLLRHEFPEVSLQNCKWHLQKSRTREQRHVQHRAASSSPGPDLSVPPGSSSSSLPARSTSTPAHTQAGPASGAAPAAMQLQQPARLQQQQQQQQHLQPVLPRGLAAHEQQGLHLDALMRRLWSAPCRHHLPPAAHNALQCARQRTYVCRQAVEMLVTHATQLQQLIAEEEALVAAGLTGGSLAAGLAALGAGGGLAPAPHAAANSGLQLPLPLDPASAAGGTSGSGTSGSGGSGAGAGAGSGLLPNARQATVVASLAVVHEGRAAAEAAALKQQTDHLATCTVPDCRRCAYELRLQRLQQGGEAPAAARPRPLSPSQGRPISGSMQSPLQALLEAVASQCDAFAGVGTCSQAADTAWELAGQQQLCADVLAVLLAGDVQGCLPDSGHVASAKQRGGAAFGRGQLPQASALYSEALRYCDEGSAEGAYVAARLYSNRALCLLRMQPPAAAAALADASAAVACDPSFPKAWYRRACAAQALEQQRRWQQHDGASTAAALPSALQDARRAAQLLAEQGAQDAQVEALVAELEAAAAAAAGGSVADSSAAAAGGGAAAASSEAANGHASHGEVAAVAGLRGLLGGAAPCLQAASMAGAGRCLAAAEALPAGADVLREAPFANAQTKLGRRSACATCLAPLAGVAAPFYCRRCPMPAYCSAACRDADPFHREGGAECRRPWPVLLPVEALAAVRLALRLRSAEHAAPGSAEVAAARQVASLGTHFQRLHPQEVAELAALAALAHAAWRQAAAEAAAAGGAAQPATGGDGGGGGGGLEEEEGVTAGDVLEALCRLQINGLAVVPAERRGSEDRLGLALYPVGALMNHSCQPNVAARFEGGTLAVRTLEAVPAGEPLLHCYGPQVGEMTTAQRRAMLQQQYHFACACRACAAAASGGPAAALVDAAPAGLRCPAARGGSPPCEGAVLPAAVVPAGMLHRYALPSGSGACCSCGAPLSAVQWEQQVLPDLALAAEAYAGAMALLEAERQRGQAAVDGGRNSGSSAPAEAQQAIRTLRQCLRQRQQLLHPRSLLLGATHDALAHAWHLAGNAEAAAQHLRHSLAVLEHAYPPHSTAAAYQRQQLALALRLAAADAAAGGAGGAAGGLLDEARSAEEEADAVLEAHFGSRAAALEG
ncbi:exostosin-like glycosyltransferase isoform B [Micractinium conductrix]|uniref:Exostosin-like glycosyltransferase isoform B n=1 Tax=Micractinium conductrix TaxID=554055 RepID=A0A2P6VRH6_9CHLO|nr:exostosin-like glycosyltransferase isoform B [Micractinium conductrix]|eukprot:PSC76706.1 exostosin-like glycosyltransferase isoform B [Micractinium conductrix]